MSDLTPAPACTATVAPSATIFLTVSGVAATRGSSASVSAITATFMNPPPARRVRSRQEKCHKYQDHDDDRERHFNQRNETAVHLFVSGIIIASCARVLDLGVIGHIHLLQAAEVLSKDDLAKTYHFSGSCFSGGLSVIALAEQPRFFMRFRLPLMPVNTPPRLARLTSNPYSSRYNRHQGQSHAQKRTK